MNHSAEHAGRLRHLRPEVSRDTFFADLGAGLAVGAMLVPQAMAYALLAGLPPEVGVYASTVPLVLYALRGTPRPLAVGPVALVSLPSSTTLASTAAAGTPGPVAAPLLPAPLVRQIGR